jgi:mannose-6-phosphate isomerase-like protein (cupin superfamily)
MMGVMWNPGDPRHPATIDDDAELNSGGHSGILSTFALAWPPALDGGSKVAFPSRVLFVGVDLYAPGGRTASHVHPDREKVFAVSEGRVLISVGDESRVLEPGGLAFVPVGVEHGFETAGDENLRVLQVIAYPVHADGDGDGGVASTVQEGRKGFSRMWSPMDPRHPSTVEGDHLPPGRHVGVLSTNTLIGPGAMYGDSVGGYAPSRRMEVGVDIYAAGGSSPMHAHADREKLFVVLSGQARITVGDESRVLERSGLAFVPADVPHGFENPGTGNLELLSIVALLTVP